jgi:TRAP transporter 4TM/12TM fusion protein
MGSAMHNGKTTEHNKKSLIEEVKRAETTRYAGLSGPLKLWFLILSTAGLLLAILFIFNVSYGGNVLLPAQYYYLLIAFYSSNIFLIMPARKKDDKLPWYDLVATFLTFCIAFYFFLNAGEITNIGWRTPPSSLQLVLGALLSIMILETGRRIAGNVYLFVCLFFASYPIFAHQMPGILFGTPLTFADTVGTHMFTTEGMLGLPAKIMGDIIIGFLLFAAVLIASGAGNFFVSFALSTFGRFRGGPAKVACLSSAMFGSVSGSAVSNVVGTGSITIPTMIKIGVPPPRAAAIEACASTGGVLMPPVMGAVAFVMAGFLGITYREVCIAAAIPAILYYFGLLTQIDAYAAGRGLKGLSPDDVPSFTKTMKNGWPYMAILAFLAWGLLYMEWEMYTPWYACALMLFLSFCNRETMMTPKKIIGTLATAGQIITTTMGAMMPVSFIIAGLTVTGSAASFSSGIVSLGGGNVFVILVLGAVASFILGMAGMFVSAYIFLAVTLAPAVIQVGQLNTIAVHLFILYWAMLSCITPPVAMAVFVAAAIGKTEPMRVGFHAVRLAVVTYFIPFFFVYNPALVFQAKPLESLYLFGLALLGVALISAGMEGYLWIYGKLKLWARPLLMAGGFLIVFPEKYTTIGGAVLIMFTLIGLKIMGQRVSKKEGAI